MVDLGNREPGFNPHINYECKTTKNWSIKNIDLKELVSKIRRPGQHITLTLKNTKQYGRRLIKIENIAKEDERRKQRIRQRLQTFRSIELRGLRVLCGNSSYSSTVNSGEIAQ
jgi:hypothetical protein